MSRDEEPNIMLPDETQRISDLHNEALADLSIALDILEDEQWDGDTAALPDERDRGCATCKNSEVDGAHKCDCAKALLLRKYGRKVKIQGDP
ncbi:MAG: hypothetical protein WC683_03050 [bacterium]